jgi:plasmid replication initiation protein
MLQRLHHQAARQLAVSRALPSELAVGDAQDLVAYPFLSLARAPAGNPRAAIGCVS